MRAPGRSLGVTAIGALLASSTHEETTVYVQRMTFRLVSANQPNGDAAAASRSGGPP
jgi:hypothetical protein